MARRARVELNHEALDEVDRIVADGLFETARVIVRVAESLAPDAGPPEKIYKRGHDPIERELGQGLVDRGGAIAWVGGKQVRRTESADGRTPKRPRGLTLRNAPSDIVVAVGFGFPALFEEFGTLEAAARPFFTPAVAEVLPDAPVILSKEFRRRGAGRRSPKTARIKAAIAASRAKKAAAVASGDEP